LQESKEQIKEARDKERENMPLSSSTEISRKTDQILSISSDITQKYVLIFTNI
jgi:hypothetical protein